MVPAIAASCLHLRTGNSPMRLTPTRLTKPICPGDSVSSSLLAGYDEPEILRSSSHRFCLTSAERDREQHL